METRQNTTAGVLFWTPAPVHSSPNSTAISEDEWDEEDEEQAEEEDDVFSQMDENGIIGLSEALENVELEECNSDGCPGSLTPEEADYSVAERDTPSEEMIYKLNELKTWSEDMEVRRRMEEQVAEHLSEWNKHHDTTNDDKDGEERGRSDWSKKKFEHTRTSGELGRKLAGLAEGYRDKEEKKEISSGQSSSVQLYAVDSVSCPASRSALPIAASILPHRLHFTAEELNTAPGIEAETFPEISFTESFQESNSSHVSLNSSPRCPEIKLRASPQPAALFSEQVISNHYRRLSNGPGKESGKRDKEHSHPTPTPRKIRKHSPEAAYSRTHSPGTVRPNKQQNTRRDRDVVTPRTRSNAVAEDESRKGPLSYHTPDFSKVEPRVHFPKGGYKPPKSRSSLTRKSLSPEPPIVFKSPADIVKEVLLNTAGESPTSPDSDRQATSAINAIVPQEFRCHQQATTLVNQLQEDYDRLLTKYAEAENTIDRLRLEAKDRNLENQHPRSRQAQRIIDRAVNLYSDPPNPGHCVQSGLNCGASKLLKFDFPRAQKPTTDQGSSATGPTEPGSKLGQQLANILFSQAETFLQQLQTFKDLLKSKKLQPFEQTEGMAQLAEGLESLERGYLLARDEHKLLQQRGIEISQFDPERELEGLIFQCGLRTDELKEQVEQMQPDQPTWITPPSPPPQPTTPSALSVDVVTFTHPQVLPVPLLSGAAEAEVSSACKENDEEKSEGEDEETLYLNPLKGKIKSVAEDFTMAVNHYRSIKELPKLLERSLNEAVLSSPALRTNMQSEHKDRQETGNNEVWKTLSQRNAQSDHQGYSSDVNKQQNSRSSPRPASSRLMMFPVFRQSNIKKVEVGKSHSSSLSSLGDVKVSEVRSSEVQAGGRRVFSQDGIISPETDSGFVGSESSRLTPATSSPLHQRALESGVPVPQEGSTSLQTGRVFAPSHFSSPLHSHTAKDLIMSSRLSLSLDQPQRCRRAVRRRTSSCSPKRCVNLRQQRVASGSSEFGLESDGTRIDSEGEKTDQYSKSINFLDSSHSSSSTTTQHHLCDSPRARSSSQNCIDAVQILQAEVTKLKERLEDSLRNKKPISSIRSAPSTQDNSSNQSSSSSCFRSREQRSDVSAGKRETQMVDEVAEESTQRRIARRKSAINQQKPQHDYLTRSALQPCAPQPQVSRCTQTSAALDSCSSHTTTVYSRRTQHRKHPVVSVSEKGDEPDSRRSQAPVCSQCLSFHRASPERPAGGGREMLHSSTCCHQCPLCGRLESYKVIKPDSHRLSDTSTHIKYQPAQSPDGAVGSRFFASAAPPALLQCMPVCPPPLLLYSSPLYVSPNRTPMSAEVTGPGEVRRRTKRRSLSVDRERSLDSSLNKAIRAARHMKHTSRHMAGSLASGLQYQELLTQSCSY
ncbi:AT-hook-containing transcription factor isoform X2 [Pundamilia nyererei]|uniref:AT-hook-containing transcription factor isoform X2 n=1 Tax=Pundamilia nyererei TaxID=303518 RepID=A0A9Y6LYZ9_9CICH|nr:PREDICTED: AT-hook-containing transcription factor isoform X2 [Pundamilia nyererei]